MVVIFPSASALDAERIAHLKPLVEGGIRPPPEQERFIYMIAPPMAWVNGVARIPDEPGLGMAI